IRHFANMFGIEGSDREVASEISSYGDLADGVISYFGKELLPKYSSTIEMSNDVQTTNNPVDLLAIFFDQRYDPRVRFEAERKLILMNLAASIAQRERAVNPGEHARRIVD